MKFNLQLHKAQQDFIYNCDSQFLGFVGGFRSGKTRSLIYKCILLSLKNLGSKGAICLPTIGMGIRGFISEWEEGLFEMGVRWEKMSYTLGYRILYRNFSSDVYILSAENFMRYRNMKLAWFAMDEADSMVGTKAWDAWDLFATRLQGGKVNQAICVSTPEGFNFMYDMFENQPSQKPDLAAMTKLIRCSSYDNPFLEDSYFPRLEALFPKNRIRGYLLGQFVNLKTATVYDCFDKQDNSTTTTISQIPHGTNLHIGIDFNYGAMSAIVCVCTDKIQAIDEIVGSSDTRNLITAIKERYPQHNIIIYPDASGKSHKTSATSTDIEMLRQARFTVNALSSNPHIKDRVNSVNRLFLSANNKRTLFINTLKCPRLTQSLLQQGYGPDGMPQKDARPRDGGYMIDGPPDALGYFIFYNWPYTGHSTLTTT